MTTPERPRPRGRFLTPLGLAVAALGIVAYVIQVKLGRLFVPWYMPAAAFAGAAMVGATLLARRSAWLWVAFVVLLALGGLQVAGLTAIRLPPYSGPIAVGKPFPRFEAKEADGEPFTQANLAGGQRTAMVFFRGRW